VPLSPKVQARPTRLRCSAIYVCYIRISLISHVKPRSLFYRASNDGFLLTKSGSSARLNPFEFYDAARRGFPESVGVRNVRRSSRVSFRFERASPPDHFFHPPNSQKFVILLYRVSCAVATAANPQPIVGVLVLGYTLLSFIFLARKLTRQAVYVDSANCPIKGLLCALNVRNAQWDGDDTKQDKLSAQARWLRGTYECSDAFRSGFDLVVHTTVSLIL
jgi:hypothetical protein